MTARVYYEDDACRLWLGDCRELLPTLDAGSAALVLTDMPYGIGDGAAFIRQRKLGKRGLVAENNDNEQWNAAVPLGDWLPLAARILMPGGHLATFHNFRAIEETLSAMRAAGLEPWTRFWWFKPNPPSCPRRAFQSGVEECVIAMKPPGPRRWFGGGATLNYWRGSSVAVADGHPCAKPEPMMGQLISALSERGDLVVDPFAGGGGGTSRREGPGAAVHRHRDRREALRDGCRAPRPSRAAQAKVDGPRGANRTCPTSGAGEVKIPRAMAWDIGAAGEDLVFDYMRRTGHGVIQSSRFLGDDGRQAPRLLFEEDRGPVLPDLDVSKGGRRFWLEVKTYENAAMNRRHSSFVHGIKLRHYNDYLRVQADTGCPADLGVVEAATGAFLVGRIETMRRYPCQCRICVKAPAVEHEVYFDRHAFDLRHCFCDDEMRAVRAFYLSLNPKWRPEPPPRLTPHATPLPPPSPLPRQPALPGFE